MKMNIEEKEARMFIILAITAAVSGWNLAFKFGVAGQIPFDFLLTIWAGSTAALLASLFWPRKNSIINWWNRLTLFTPSLWFVVSWMDINMDRFTQADEFTFVISLIILFVCVPYTVILLITITNRELFEIKTPRLRVGLAGVILVVYLIAYFTGVNHTAFVTCEDFDLSGDFVPADCISEADLEG